MSKSWNSRNKQLHETLSGCKGGPHEVKEGQRAKRSRQQESFRRDLKQQRWQEM